MWSNIRANLSGRFREIIDPILLVAAILLVWEFGVRLFDISVLIIPGPSVIIETLISLIALFQNEIAPTLFFIVFAFILGVVFGVLSAFIIHHSAILYRILFPVLVTGFIIPKIALAPLLLLYLGAGTTYYTLVPFLFVYFPILENTLTGLRGVDKDLKDLTSLYHPSRWFRFRNVLIPYALPYIGAGVKIGMTSATIGVVIAEFVAPSQGLGSLLITAEAYGNTAMVFASIFVIGLVGIILYKLVEIIEGRIIFWKDVRGGAA